MEYEFTAEDVLAMYVAAREAAERRKMWADATELRWAMSDAEWDALCATVFPSA
jgi:hypothetical protein